MIRLQRALPLSTTFRSIVCVLLLGLATPAGGEPVSEEELVRRFLETPVTMADVEAEAARTRADRTAVSLVDSPVVEVRHEKARGDWGSTTTAVGASLTLDLGLSPLAHSRAGRFRGVAGEYRREAALLESVCVLRAEALDLWAASLSASTSQTSQQRLDQLLQTFAELALAGESSGYERDRTALAVLAHKASAAERLTMAEALRARLSTLSGEAVAHITLADFPEVPALEESIALLGGHPLLEALTLERDAAKATRDAARLDQLPDLTLSGGSRWDGPPSGGSATQGFELGGALQIPWMNGGRAEARQQTAEYAAAQARLAWATTDLEAEVRGAHRRLDVLLPTVTSAPEGVWTMAMERYGAGEASLDELLQLVDAVEGVHFAEVDRERLRRGARLDLSCATGRFAEPTIQSVFEEALR